MNLELNNPSPAAAEIFNLLKRAVDEKGADYVVGKCQYFPVDRSGNTEPFFTSYSGVCIIGKAMEYYNTGEMLAVDHNFMNITNVIDKYPSILPSADTEAEEQRITNSLVAAQITQDDNQTWGKALEEFVNTYNGSR